MLPLPMVVTFMGAAPSDICLYMQTYQPVDSPPVSDRGSADRLSPAELKAWQGLLRVSARLERVLDADLERSHALSGNDYDVLIQLGLAPRRRLRMTTLAEQVLMSPSGVSRLVDTLEREGLVARERGEDDARTSTSF